MRRTEALQGMRMAVFLNILSRWESAALKQEEAAELLGVSERTFRRWTRRYEEEGEAGLLDRRLGKASGRRVPVDRAEEVERLYRERYQGFTVKHFHEHLVRGAERGVSAARPADEPLHRPGQPLFPKPPRPARSTAAHRPRSAGPLSSSGSSTSGPIRRIARGETGVLPDALCPRPIGTGVRDAAGPAAEGTQARRRHRHQGGQRLHPGHLPAGAQRPLRHRSGRRGLAFTPIPGVDLDEILCVEEERQVGQDNCVSYQTLKLQIPESPMRPHFVKARVKVHVYPDGSHAVFHGPRCIGRYDEKDWLKNDGLLQRAVYLGSAAAKPCERNGQASGLPTPRTGTKAEEADNSGAAKTG